jgi:hypothetical protein
MSACGTRITRMLGGVALLLAPLPGCRPPAPSPYVLRPIVDTAGLPSPPSAAPLAASTTYHVDRVVVPAVPLPMTNRDRAAAREARRAAARDSTLRIVISVADRRLWVVDRSDTLLAAPAAVGMDARLEYGGRVWIFRTPRGVRSVRTKTMGSAWIPPDWHYAEVAREHGLALALLPPDRPIPLADGRYLGIRNGEAGVISPDGRFATLPTDEEIVFDGTLFIPPIGSRNRRIEGELGPYQLDLGDGYLIHGTPQRETIGTAATHGCVRLADPDITWLYEHVPVGTPVYIY